MPATQTRSAARQRILDVTSRALDKVIPPDEGMALRGKTFSDFEDQVEEVGRALMTTLLEERAALDATAWLERPGRCPRCDSDRVYLEKQVTVKEVLSPAGPLQVRLQHCRCRACNGSFSPSGQGLATAHRGSADSARLASRLP